MNVTQHWIALLVTVGLLVWLIGYWWMLSAGRRQPKRTDEGVEVEKGNLNRLDKALLALRSFQQQPTLESARLNYLRQLAFSELHDLILLALSAVNYVVSMDHPPQPYEMPVLEAVAPDPELIIEFIPALSAEPTRKGRLTRSMESVVDRLEPVVESGNVFTADGRTVLLSIQIHGSQYSRYGLSRLAQAAAVENLPGLLIYLGTSPLNNLPVSGAVLMSGSELMLILERLEL